MRLSDFLLGLLFVVLGACVFAYAITLPTMPGQRYGAGAFPAVLAICIMTAGGVLSWRAYRRGELAAGIAGLAPWMRDPALRTNVLLTLGAIVAYIFLDDYFGFIPLAFCILLMLFLRFRIPVGKAALIAGATVLFIQVTFVSMLRVPLPRGILDRVLWW